jgi:hypothetical protein
MNFIQFLKPVVRILLLLLFNVFFDNFFDFYHLYHNNKDVGEIKYPGCFGYQSRFGVAGRAHLRLNIYTVTK